MGGGCYRAAAAHFTSGPASGPSAPEALIGGAAETALAGERKSAAAEQAPPFPSGLLLLRARRARTAETDDLVETSLPLVPLQANA